MHNFLGRLESEETHNRFRYLSTKPLLGQSLRRCVEIMLTFCEPPTAQKQCSNIQQTLSSLRRALTAIVSQKGCHGSKSFVVFSPSSRAFLHQMCGTCIADKIVCIVNFKLDILLESAEWSECTIQYQWMYTEIYGQWVEVFDVILLASNFGQFICSTESSCQG